MPITPAVLHHALTVAGYQPGERFEVAAKPQGVPTIHTTWRRFDEGGLERAARWLQPRRRTQDLYLLANPIKPGARRRKRASDADVGPVRCLLVDVDPVKVKPKDVAKAQKRGDDWPTDADLDELGTRPDKLAAAEEIAGELRAFFSARLEVDVPLVSSGRGRQLWLLIDGAHPRAARQRFVRALAERFDRPRIATLDVATYNEARLMRLPGGINSRTGGVAEVLDDGCGRLCSVDTWLRLVEEIAPERKPRRRASRPQARQHHGGDEAARFQSALGAISADCGYEAWRSVGMALRASSLPEGEAYAMWDAWSATGGEYPGQAATRAKWRSFKPTGPTATVGPGTLFDLAYKNGWTPPPRSRSEEELLPLLDPPPAPVVATAREDVERLIESVVRAPSSSSRSGAGPVVQDRRPTGSGKTSSAARRVVDAAAELATRYLWASPSHDLARLEVLPALARAGAAIVDEDLDGASPPESSVRAELARMGATVVELGDEAPAGQIVAAKLDRFACPGPDVPGWDSEKVEELYAARAAAGWNPTATVCRACPRFRGREGADPCPWWEARRLATQQADVLVVPHHSMRAGAGSAKGRRALVIDEDPGGALVKLHAIDERSSCSFGALIDAVDEHEAARLQGLVERLEQLSAAAKPAAPQGEFWIDHEPFAPEDPDVILARAELEAEIADAELAYEELGRRMEAVRVVLRELRAHLAGWRELGGELEPGYDLPTPAGVDLTILGDLDSLAKACERVLRSLSRRDEQLSDANGERVGQVRNLLPVIRELARRWGLSGRATVETEQGEGGHPQAVLPVVQALPELPILALDATGDSELLSLAAGRRDVVEIEGDLTAKLHGVHLVDVPCGRSRYKRGHKALQTDVGVVLRYARRVGAKRVGLVTFKGTKEKACELIRLGGLEVEALHYGAEVGSNAFAPTEDRDGVDLVVVLGTPFVPPRAVRRRALLHGAALDEVRTSPEWDYRRLRGGGSCSVLRFPGEATHQAYAALVRARLEQALGRALRWDWTPRCGALVLAEPWPSRHRLKVTTRYREALDGAPAELLEVLERAGLIAVGDAENGSGGDLVDAIRGSVRGLIAELGGADRVAELTKVTCRSVRRWIAGESFPDPAALNVMSISRNRAQKVTLAANENGAHVCFRTHPLRRRCLKGVRPKTDMSGEIENRTGDMGNSGKSDMNETGESDMSESESKVNASGESDMDAQALVERALTLAGGKTRLLGKATGFSPTSIRRWRNGSLSPGEKTIRRLQAFVAEREAAEVEPGSLRSTTGSAASESGAPVEPDAPDWDRISALVDEAAMKAGNFTSAAKAIGGVTSGRLLRWRDRSGPPPTSEQLLDLVGYVGDPELVPVSAGETVPGVGRVYAPAAVPVEDVMPEDPMAALRAWADPKQHPSWLVRAVSRAKGTASLANWLGRNRRGGGEVRVDQDLALERANGLIKASDTPVQVRAALGPVARLLAKRGAKLPSKKPARGGAPVGREPIVEQAEAELEASPVRR